MPSSSELGGCGFNSMSRETTEKSLSLLVICEEKPLGSTDMRPVSWSTVIKVQKAESVSEPWNVTYPYRLQSVYLFINSCLTNRTLFDISLYCWLSMMKFGCNFSVTDGIVSVDKSTIENRWQNSQCLSTTTNTLSCVTRWWFTKTYRLLVINIVCSCSNCKYQMKEPRKSQA